MTIDFASIAPYLKDPLILIGFVIFLGFLFTRILIIKGIIPQLDQGQGASILKLILFYGFIIGIVIIILGFGLKYQNLSEKEQKNAVELLKSELEHNIYIVSELKKNTNTFSSAVSIVSSILRRKDFKINSGLFPSSNIDPNSEQDPDLYNKRIIWLEKSGFLEDENILRRFREQNAAIVRTVNRTKSTLDSLGDQKAKRYLIERKAFDSNLDILRKVHIVNVTDLANLYAKTSEVREKYFRIASMTIEYLVSIREFCSFDKPDHTALGSVLAIERLTARLLPEYKKQLNEIIDQISKKTKQFSLSLNI